MHDGDINYSKYTLRELDEGLSGINKQLYPQNYANLLSALELLKRTRQVVSTPIAPVKQVEDLELAPRYDDFGRYIPNHISTKDRMTYVGFSILLAAYGSYGIWVNDIYIPGKRSRGIHLHDVPAWVMYGAIICACLVMLSVIADHYDNRNNEKHYRAFADAGKYIGWTLFGISLIMALFQ